MTIKVGLIGFGWSGLVFHAPSVTQLYQIQILYALATQKSLVFCVYQNRLFDADLLCLKTLIDSGELGPSQHLESGFDRFWLTAQLPWREELGV